MRRLLLLAGLGSALLASPAFASEACACGDPGCEQACTCAAGVCPLHRPGPLGPDAGTPVKVAPAPAPRVTPLAPAAKRVAPPARL